jgi:hypothetical protein
MNSGGNEGQYKFLTLEVAVFQKYYIYLLGTQQNLLTCTFTSGLEIILQLVSINFSNGRPYFWNPDKMC